MEKETTEEHTINDRGTEWDATVIYWSYGHGGTDRVSVNLVCDYVGEPQQRYDFNVTDRTARECVFAKTDLDGAAEPNRPAMKALSKFGWSCTNFSLDQIKRKDYENVGPTLQFADDALAGMLTLEDSTMTDYPFLLDLLEVAETAIALTNTLIYPEYAPEAVGITEEDDQYLDKLFAEENRHILRQFARIECANDPYNGIFLPPLLKAHFDMTLTEQEVKGVEENTTVEDLRQLGIDPDSSSTERRRPPGFDGIRYADWYSSTSTGV
jgi:hypothetical protein